ncbi:MAG: 3D-(3,5/4)-trihydroxycyclohexane-1,2-dione acylhydrolase (decyclizing) [Rhodospirillales bacterium]|nr:3D-(3,5/4)-trihydroxycyclohexane-1,2-dione acylhydrolase (decyclizing) [Rhodospirillales bacterium]
MKTVRLTMAQALVRYLCAQRTEIDGQELPLFAGVFAIFGHGIVAGLGEALYAAREELPTFRGHNEQAFAHTAIAFAKASNRRRMMACASSIGPGATNMVTAAALAHVNRLPVLFLPGDIFASRRPDPVLQQVENFGDGTVSANDCFRPVSRYWDRITRPEQLLVALPVALDVLTDPANCGPVTLAIPQDVQAMAFDYPVKFFEPRMRRARRIGPDIGELEAAAKALQNAEKPLIVAGGGVHYSLACKELSNFAERHGIPVTETQAGKGALAWDHPNQVGSLGVTGASAANTLAAEADVILAVGTRLGDFTTASHSVFANETGKLIQLNVQAFDSVKHGALSLVSDAKRGLEALDEKLGTWCAPSSWGGKMHQLAADWNEAVERATKPTNVPLPTDAQVLGAANRAAGQRDVVVCAAGGLPGELHKLWQTPESGGYHMEYGYSCMGYEIAGGLGVKMADPSREVYVLVGDGSYLMLNSEIATSVLMGLKLIIVVLDNRGFGCINRLQRHCGNESFNNLFSSVRIDGKLPDIDFAAHAASLGAISEKAASLAELEAALERAKEADQTYVVTIDTDPIATTEDGGAWWDVAVPEVSERAEVRSAREGYIAATKKQRTGE